MEYIEFLKSADYDTYTLKDKNHLERIGIINGVWPEGYGRVVRTVMTWLFWDVLDYKRHDVAFWKQEWFHKANYWLIKYSFISIADSYVRIHKGKWYKKLYKIPLDFITLPFKAIIIFLAYSAVEWPKGKQAYKNCKNFDIDYNSPNN